MLPLWTGVAPAAMVLFTTMTKDRKRRVLGLVDSQESETRENKSTKTHIKA